MCRGSEADRAWGVPEAERSTTGLEHRCTARLGLKGLPWAALQSLGFILGGGMSCVSAKGNGSDLHF